MSLPSNFLTATETIGLVQAGTLTVSQIAEDHLARYDERQPEVEAWVYLDKERVRQEAKRLDGIPSGERGPLHGCVLGIKDVILTKDMPTQHNSPIYKDSRPGLDAGVVQICRKAGALIYGKTYTTEFAAMRTGVPTKNPYNLKHTPGGTSSGSAAAVGDWQCQVAFGTQTAGSAIRPASFNGIFCMKPTWGSVGREGLKMSSVTLDTLGIFSRSVDDLELFTKVFHIADDETPVPRPLSSCSFAYIKTDQWDANDGASPELVRAWAKSKELLEKAGAKVEEVALPSEFDKIPPGRHLTVMHSEGGVNFLADYKLAKDKLGAPLQARVENHSNITHRAYLDAFDSIASLRPMFDKIASQYDAVITPSAAGGAPEGFANTGDARFCNTWTGLHVPVINVPGFGSESGMPLGLSLLAPRYQDEHLLAVAAEVAKVWCGSDDALLSTPTAPIGAKHASV